MSEKTVNYTAEQTAELVSAYESAETEAARQAVVETFAEKFNRKVASVRSKLVAEGVYVKAERKSKTGEAIVSKAQLVETIASNIGVASEAFESLEKANKAVLKVLAKATEVKTEAVE